MVAAELHNLAYVELHDGRSARAKELFAEALTDARRLSYDALLPYLVGDAAVVAAEEGDAERAALLAGAAQATFRAAGQVPDPDDAAEQERLTAAFEEGAGLAVEEALGDSL